MLGGFRVDTPEVGEMRLRVQRAADIGERLVLTEVDEATPGEAQVAEMLVPRQEPVRLDRMAGPASDIAGRPAAEPAQLAG